MRGGGAGQRAHRRRRYLPGGALAAPRAAAPAPQPFDIYRALRRLNPSPYMFFFDFAALAGDAAAAPDRRLARDARAPGRRARPPSGRSPGTRPRGETPAEDAALEQELLADPKERAEHVMLVDLARNDLGRVCEYGSVQRARADGGRALLARHAHRLAGGRQAAPGLRRLRPAARHLPGRHGQRRAQGPRHADHRRAGARRRAASTPGRWATSPPTAAWTPASPSAPW